MTLKNAAIGLLVLMSFSLFSPPVNAQMVQTGTLNGLAQEKGGSGLPGVTVTIKSPALILPQMAALTNERGYYRFPALPPGLYSMTFELTGFTTLIREGIRVRVGETTSLNIELEISKEEKSVTVVGQSPAVDVKTSTLTTVYPTEFLEALPTARSELYTLLNLVPGATNQNVHGGATSDNSFLLDGVNITHPASGTLQVSYGFDIIEELTIDTGALRAEYGNAKGAVMNAVTKSGGNEIHGQANLYFRNKKLQSDNTKGTPLEGQFVGFDYQYDWALNVGGPIVKNKLWFFANMNYYSENAYINGFPWDKTQNVPVDNWRYYPFAKFSWQLSEKDKLVFSYNHQNIRRTNRDASMYYNEEATTLQTNPTNTFNLHWTRFFNSNFFMNAKASYVTVLGDYTPKNDLIGLYDTTLRHYYQSAGYHLIGKRPKIQFQADGTLFVDDWMGSHEFKAGMETYLCDGLTQYIYNKDPRYNLGYQIVLMNGVPSYINHREDYAQKDRSFMIGGYVQDSWTLAERLTLNLGFRYEHMEYTVPKQGQDRKAVVYQGVTYDPSVKESYTPVNWNTVAPRLAASYSLTNDNKTVVKASFGRYYAKMATNFYSAANPNGPMSWRLALNPDWTVKGDPYLFSAQAEAKIDPNIKPYYTDEVTIGLERELLEDMKLGIRYIQKWDRNLVEDIDVNALDMDAFNRGELVWKNYDPYSATDPFNGQPVTFWGVRNTAITFSQYITNPPGGNRDYNAVEVTFTKRYSRRWQMIASYVYANAKDLVSMTGANSGLFNNPNAMVNAYGRDPRVPPHQIKLQGSYSGPWGINISGYFYAFSGAPKTRTIRSNDLGLKLAQGNVTIYAEEKGSRQDPSLAIFDFRLDKSFKLPGKLGRLELILDILNLFNANTATATESVSSNPALFTFGKMTAITDPRIFRLAVRIDF